MNSLAGMQLVGGPFAIWAATLQIMPGGALDAGFGRFFVGVRVANNGTVIWPITHARLSKRSRQQLANAGLVVDDGWSASDALTFDQEVLAGRVIVPALTSGSSRTIFFKLDATRAHPGVHDVEIEVFEPSSPSGAVSARVPLRVVRTGFDSHSQSFVAVADAGTLSVSIASAAFDVEALRVALGKAHALFPAGAASAGSAASQLDRLRAGLQGFLCGENEDICAILAELEAFCALPPAPAPLPGSIPGLDGYAVFGDQAADLADRVNIDAGNCGSNRSIQLGVEDLLASNVVAGGDIVLHDRAVVSGGAIAKGTVRVPDSARVVGSIREHAAYAQLTLPTRSVSAGTRDITLAAGSQTVAPGAYGVVQSTGRSTFAFSAGLYQFRRLVIGPDTTLALDVARGLIDIRVLERLSFGDRVVFDVTHGPSAGRVQFYSDQGDEVRIGTDIPTFAGSVLAPKGTIHQFSRTKVSGALWAKTVTIEPDCSVALAAPQGVGTDWVGQGASGLELVAYPMALDTTLEYRDGFLGSIGPSAVEGLPWKSLLANVSLAFNLALGQALAAALAATAEELVVGKVKAAVLNASATPPSKPPTPAQPGSVDAAVSSLLGNRALGSPPFSQLDAQAGEANARPVNEMGGRVALSGGCLTNSEINALLANAAGDPEGLAVYKSGAGTGVTRGLVNALLPIFSRPDASGPLAFVNQLAIATDPAFPSLDNQVASSGDSGALWVHTRTGKIIALGHAVGTAGSAVASRIEDVMNALHVQFA